MNPEYFEKLLTDERIIRNQKKIESVIFNAELFETIIKEHGSFGKFLVNWPKYDQYGLYVYLNKGGSRFGLATTGYFLRFMGYDAYLLSRDVVKALLREKVISTNNPNYSPTSKKDLQAIQDAFNVWKSEGKYSYAQISRVLACSVD